MSTAGPVIERDLTTGSVLHVSFSTFFVQGLFNQLSQGQALCLLFPFFFNAPDGKKCEGKLESLEESLVSAQ
jgi:hypothetical protein